MKGTALRTLLILACGAIMALAALAGQSGHRSDQASPAVHSVADGY